MMTHFRCMLWYAVRALCRVHMSVFDSSGCKLICRFLKWDDAPCDLNSVGGIKGLCEVETR